MPADEIELNRDRTRPGRLHTSATAAPAFDGTYKKRTFNACAFVAVDRDHLEKARLLFLRGLLPRLNLHLAALADHGQAHAGALPGPFPQCD